MPGDAMMRRLALLVMLAAALGCATTGPRREATGIPVEVENFAVEDVTVYIVTGGTTWRIGRAAGTETTSLQIPRAFEHQVISMAARFDAGKTIVSHPFVVTADGFTMTIARQQVGVFGSRS